MKKFPHLRYNVNKDFKTVCKRLFSSRSMRNKLGNIELVCFAE